MITKKIGAFVSVVALALLLSGVAYAQTGTTDTTYTTPDTMTTTDTLNADGTTGTTGATSPGLPNTGFGGNAAANVGMLLASGFIVLAGAYYMVARERFV